MGIYDMWQKCLCLREVAVSGNEASVTSHSGLFLDLPQETSQIDLDLASVHSLSH